MIMPDLFKMPFLYIEIDRNRTTITTGGLGNKDIEKRIGDLVKAKLAENKTIYLLPVEPQVRNTIFDSLKENKICEKTDRIFHTIREYETEISSLQQEIPSEDSKQPDKIFSLHKITSLIFKSSKDQIQNKFKEFLNYLEKNKDDVTTFMQYGLFEIIIIGDPNPNQEIDQIISKWQKNQQDFFESKLKATSDEVIKKEQKKIEEEQRKEEEKLAEKQHRRTISAPQSAPKEEQPKDCRSQSISIPLGVSKIQQKTNQGHSRQSRRPSLSASGSRAKPALPTTSAASGSGSTAQNPSAPQRPPRPTMSSSSSTAAPSQSPIKNNSALTAQAKPSVPPRLPRPNSSLLTAAPSKSPRQNSSSSKVSAKPSVPPKPQRENTLPLPRSASGVNIKKPVPYARRRSTTNLNNGHAESRNDPLLAPLRNAVNEISKNKK